MPDFSTVTEITGNKVTKEQIERMVTRYQFALGFCDNKDVLEIACGSGQGLGLLAKKARKVVGGDIDENNLKLALKHYKNRDNIELKILDAHQLPFNNGSFDVVILFEAIYYLHDPASFVKEAWRVLKKDGLLLICTANKDCPGFNPSPYSFSYFSTSELMVLLNENGFKDIAFYGDCPVENTNLRDRIVSLIKQSAVRLNLIPKTMKGKELFKMIFFGKLKLLPEELCDEMGSYKAPVSVLPDRKNHQYKVLMACARKT
jgi:SAM-dependent methyltransferase